MSLSLIFGILLSRFLLFRRFLSRIMCDPSNGTAAKEARKLRPAGNGAVPSGTLPRRTQFHTLTYWFALVAPRCGRFFLLFVRSSCCACAADAALESPLSQYAIALYFSV